MPGSVGLNCVGGGRGVGARLAPFYPYTATITSFKESLVLLGK